MGRIVIMYVSAFGQLTAWLIELGVPAPPVCALAIRGIVPLSCVAKGPISALAEQVRELHRRFYSAAREAKPQTRSK